MSLRKVELAVDPEVRASLKELKGVKTYSQFLKELLEKKESKN